MLDVHILDAVRMLPRLHACLTPMAESAEAHVDEVEAVSVAADEVPAAAHVIVILVLVVQS